MTFVILCLMIKEESILLARSALCACHWWEATINFLSIKFVKFFWRTMRWGFDISYQIMLYITWKMNHTYTCENIPLNGSSAFFNFARSIYFLCYQRGRMIYSKHIQNPFVHSNAAVCVSTNSVRHTFCMLEFSRIRSNKMINNIDALIVDRKKSTPICAIKYSAAAIKIKFCKQLQIVHVLWLHNFVHYLYTKCGETLFKPECIQELPGLIFHWTSIAWNLVM